MLNSNQLQFIKNEEGFRGKAYKNGPREPWTIGYGFTYYEDGTKVKQYDTMDRDRADKFFTLQANARLDQIMKSLVPVDRVLKDNQKLALLSLHYNIGQGNWMRSSVRRLLLAGNPALAADAFLMWHRGNTENDLLPRRQRERTLFLN